MVQLGVLESYPDEHGVDRVFIPQLCVGALEWVMAGNVYDEHPEQSVLFKQFTYGSSGGNGIYMPMSNHGVHRAEPVEKALENESRKLDWEEISEIVEKNGNGSFCAVKCICRRSMNTLEAGAGEPSLYWCMPLGHLADYCIRKGIGIKLTKDEYLERLRQAEDRGFVHNVANANGQEVEYICNCDLPLLLYSAHGSLQLQFEHDTFQFHCSGRSGQVRCLWSLRREVPNECIQDGQRLNPKEGCKYYHYQDTPHEHMKWGADRHHPNYLYERSDVWMETGTAPCKTACPAHIAVEGYLKLARMGRYEDALKLIKYNNPLPAVCGAICNRRCEAACTRGQIDDPIAIDEVKKFLADRKIHKDQRYIPKKEVTLEKPAKIAVIGSGPAGLAAAYYLEVKGDQVTVFEKNQKLGGMLRYGIPSFRLEKDVLDAEFDVIKTLGAEFKTGVAVGRDITLEDLGAQGCKAIFVPIGMQGGRQLGVPGEDAEGIVSFMRENGPSDCTGEIVVVGGGNVAVDVARTALRCGASHVQMFCLEQR